MNDISKQVQFHVDQNKCIHCGMCEKVCNGAVIAYDEKGFPYLKPFEHFGGAGCWKCQHCLAVCPVGAISILGKNAEDCTSRPDRSLGEEEVKLVNYRRSCRRYLDRDVDAETLDEILSAMENVPNGGNFMNIEYTVIDDHKLAKQIRETAFAEMEEAASHGIYASTINKTYYEQMKERAKIVRKGDLLFSGAPQFFIAHAKADPAFTGDVINNCVIADAYFEILAGAFGLGTLIMSYAPTVLNELAPKAKKMTGIPDDHVMPLIVGFGYPEIKYARGVCKDRGNNKTHRASKGTLY